MARDELWDMLRENAKRNHAERVAKTPERLRYAMDRFEKEDIKYRIVNDSIGHFHVWRKSDDKLFQFWCSTGTILLPGGRSTNHRGIEACIRIAKREK